MLNELWKTLEEDSRYEISNLGNVRVKSTKKLRKFFSSKTSKYLSVTIHQQGKTKNFLVHRLVAKYFVPNPDNKPQVNHIDFNHLNNQADNLEWVTAKENHTHSVNAGRITYKTQLGNKEPNSVSKYHNVCYRKDKQRWTSTLKIDGKRMSGKLFKTEEEAAKWTDELLRMNGVTDRPFNFP